MKYFLLFFLCLALNYGFSQKSPLAVGLELKTNRPGTKIDMPSIYGEIALLDSSLVIRGSIGGFFPITQLYSGGWKGNMLTVGVAGGYFLRSAKKYQPGLSIEFNTMIPPPGAEPNDLHYFTSLIFIDDSRFKGIPFAFSPKFANMFWFNRLGLEVGVGYRYYLCHYQNDILANFYRPMHRLEWSLGCKFRIN